MQVRNSITLIGNLGSAPKTTTLPSGTLVTEFSLATNDYYRDKEGNRQTRTEWHKVKAYGKLAETLGKYLEQGSQVCIAGALRYNKWLDKYEQVRVTAEIVADSFTFLSAGKQQAEMEEEDVHSLTPVAEPAPKAAKKRKAKASTASKEVEEEALPF